LVINFAFGLAFSIIAFYFFWTRYRNQSLTLELRNQQLKASESDNLRQQAENRLLQSQLEPHFLFNTLANIQSLIDIDSDLAKTMISDLSSMLRATLKNTSRNKCTVAQELSLVQAYIGIQKVRIGEKLDVVEKIDENTLALEIPPMIIQPLVENSIKHGIDRSVSKATIELKTLISGNELIISVCDNCIAKGTDKSGHQISVSNISKRLQNTYGEQASLLSEKSDPGWSSVIRIPLSDQSTKENK
jgi:LytS/YehU family sensor histidine kinase